MQLRSCRYHAISYPTHWYFMVCFCMILCLRLHHEHWGTLDFFPCLIRLISILFVRDMWKKSAYLRRLELKGNKYVLGEFIEFKGKEEDLHSLRKIKRSKISQLSVQKISMFGLGKSSKNSLFHIIICFRSLDYNFTTVAIFWWILNYFHNLQLIQLYKFCLHPAIIVLMGLQRHHHIGKRWLSDLARR